MVKMKLVARVKNIWNAAIGKPVGINDGELLEWLGIQPVGMSKKAINEVTYFTCLKMLSETMGKLPLKLYKEQEQGRVRADQTDTSYVLTVRPNPYTTPSTLWGTIEMNCQHYGNGYIWLRRKYIKKGKYGGEYKTLDAWNLPSNCVEVIMDNAGIFADAGKLYYVYSDPRSGKQHIFQSDEILHMKTWFSLDGVMGEPVKKILQHTIDGANESQRFMNNLYKNGLTASMALQYTGDFDEKKINALKRKFADKLTGSDNAGKVIPIPMGLTLTPLKIALTDAQFFELRKYSALQIAGAFGIKPNQINNYEKSSYSNSEMQQLAFLVDTMAYRIKQYEEEINAKALTVKESKQGFLYKFNEKAILRTDAKTQMEILKQAVSEGIYSRNEAREYLDRPGMPGGDILTVNGNCIPLTMAGQQYVKEDTVKEGIENGENGN